MDHIPLPHKCSFRHLQVPYLQSDLLDDGDWSTYPQRHGWQVDLNRKQTILLQHHDKRPVAENAAFIQSWLYFGLLREVLKDHITLNQLIQRELDGKQYISTQRLESILAAWTAHFLKEDDIPTLKGRLDKLYELLLEHRTIGLTVYMLGANLGDDSILLSVAVLSERLLATVIDIHAHLGLETPVEQAWRLRTKGLPDIGQRIIKSMRVRGWCPYDLRRIDIETREVSMLYYYSNLEAPRSSKDHGGCSEEQCLAMMTNPLTYKLSHCYEGCDCPLLFADQVEVAGILTRESIPLIKITPITGPGAPKITVHELHDQDFVAISHVWAEGAGNLCDNALQTCLLENISDLAKKLPWDEGQSDFPFWIDTLCVPVRPPELQTLALNKMRAPYERAKHVLVLDPHLRCLDSKILTPTEIFAQVSCSSWMRRLWTLQEGRLAKKVWFQFADQAVDVQNVFFVLDRRRIPSRFEYWIGAALYIRLWMHIWHRGDRVANTSAVAASLSSTSHALTSRSVSVPTDEALCLFTLMGMDLTQVTAVPPADRMAVFWRAFQRVPRGLLFSRAPSKMSEPGLHWAPSSFMGFQSDKEWNGPQDLSSPKEDDPHAVPTSAGLQIALPGLILHKDLIARMRQFDFTWNVDLIVQDGNSKSYAMRLEEPWRQGIDISASSAQLAIILTRELIPNHQSSEIFSFQDLSVGLLVSVDKSRDDVLYVTAYNHVALELLGKGTQRYLSSARLCAERVNIDHAILLDELHTASKERYRKAAEDILDDKATLDLLAGQARHLGEKDEYESLLDDLMDTTVVAARFGDCSKVQKVAVSQQWCVD
ncbi:MAG: hypothetical protein Q9170_001291 [Blastenia crenularia]